MERILAILVTSVAALVVIALGRANYLDPVMVRLDLIVVPLIGCGVHHMHRRA
jgi:hypothetical protein